MAQIFPPGARPHTLALTLWMISLLIPGLADAQTNYLVNFREARGHYAEVYVTYDPATIEPEELIELPVWTPGSYTLREYARHVQQVGALDERGQELPVQKVTKSAWRVQTGGRPFTFRYRIYLNELTVRNAHIDSSHAFINPAAVLPYTRKRMGGRHTLTIEPLPAWRSFSTALRQVPMPAGTPAPEHNRGALIRFEADHYDELVDSPLELGTHPVQTFERDGCRYELAFYGAPAEGLPQSLVDQISRVVGAANAMFGGRPPMSRYVFIGHLLPGGGGGLEHMASTVVQADVDLPTKPDTWEGFLSLCAHEYFHLWNVKRIRPFRLGPFDYDRENYTTMLWLAEGFTSYYDKVLLAQAGLITRERLTSLVASQLSAVDNTLGTKVQALEEASFDAWIKYYHPTDNSPNSTVSYYTQGAALAVTLDLYVRAQTAGRRSLDDVMRRLWARAQADATFYVTRETFTETLSQVTLEGIEPVSAARLAELKSTQQALNKQLVDEITMLVRTYVTEPIKPPFREMFDLTGITVLNRGNRGPELPLRVSYVEGGAVVTYIRAETGVAMSGLSTGDLITAIDGRPVPNPLTPEAFGITSIERMPRLRASVIRRGRPMTFLLPPESGTLSLLELTLPTPLPPSLESWGRPVPSATITAPPANKGGRRGGRRVAK